MYRILLLSEKCRIEESNGFLKEKCPDPSGFQMANFKCPFSEEYYYNIFEVFLENSEHPFVNYLCSDDPYGFQVFFIKFAYIFKAFSGC